MSFWPTFHALKAAVAKVSTVAPSGRRRATYTSTWFDVSRSNCARRSLRTDRRAPPTTPAWSVAYRSGRAGTSCAADAIADPQDERERRVPHQLPLAPPPPLLPPPPE